LYPPSFSLHLRLWVLLKVRKKHKPLRFEVLGAISSFQIDEKKKFSLLISTSLLLYGTAARACYF